MPLIAATVMVNFGTVLQEQNIAFGNMMDGTKLERSNNKFGCSVPAVEIVTKKVMIVILGRLSIDNFKLLA